MPTNQHPTGTGQEGGAAPLPRLRPVPNTDPPALSAAELLEHYAPSKSTVVAGQTALALDTDAAPRWAPLAVDCPEVAAQASGDADLPDPSRVCATLASAVIEVLAGRRPVAQLTRWTTEDVHRGLTQRAALVARLQPSASQGRGQRPAVVRRMRLTRPADGVVEAAAVVLDTDRVRAVALRLEGWDTRWRLTALEIG